MPTTNGSPDHESIYDRRNRLIWGISDARADSRRTKKVLIPLPLDAILSFSVVFGWPMGRRHTDRVKREAQP